MKMPQRLLNIASFYFRPVISRQWSVVSFSATLNTHVKSAVILKDHKPTSKFTTPLCGGELFVPERDQRIDLRRSQGRNEAGRHRHSREQQRNDNERRRIGRAHSVEHIGHQASQTERGDQSNRYSAERHFHSMVYDQAQNVPAPCAERDADSEFVCSLTDQI